MWAYLWVLNERTKAYVTLDGPAMVATMDTTEEAFALERSTPADLGVQKHQRSIDGAAEVEVGRFAIADRHGDVATGRRHLRGVQRRHPIRERLLLVGR